VKVLDLYRRDDNALHVPETGGSPRLFFFALGHQAIGFSPFGIDFTRIHAIPDAARPKDELLTPWALTGTGSSPPLRAHLRLDRPHGRDIARLNFEGKRQATPKSRGSSPNR